MKKRPDLSKEINIFHESMKDIKLHVQDKVQLKPKKLHGKRTTSTSEDITLLDSLNLPHVQAEEFIAYKQSSISNKTLRKMRKGQYNVEAKLDLHGMSVEEARVAVARFLQECLNEKMRVVLIVHGKGHHSHQPILKNKLNHWLRELNFVLAFCSAALSHGSRGAVYVLLKRQLEEDSLE